MRVFISHVSQEKKLAGFLADRLTGAGFHVWRAEEQILPGDNWALKVGRALEESDTMIVLVSPDAARSQWVRREIEYALGSPNYAGRVIPIVVRPTDDMPWVLRSLPSFRASKDRAQLSRSVIHQLQKAQAG